MPGPRSPGAHAFGPGLCPTAGGTRATTSTWPSARATFQVTPLQLAGGTPALATGLVPPTPHVLADPADPTGQPGRHRPPVRRPRPGGPGGRPHRPSWPPSAARRAPRRRLRRVPSTGAGGVGRPGRPRWSEGRHRAVRGRRLRLLCARLLGPLRRGGGGGGGRVRLGGRRPHRGRVLRGAHRGDPHPLPPRGTRDSLGPRTGSKASTADRGSTWSAGRRSWPWRRSASSWSCGDAPSRCGPFPVGQLSGWYSHRGHGRRLGHRTSV